MCNDHPDFLFPALGLHPIQGSYSIPEDSSACSLSEYIKFKVPKTFVNYKLKCLKNIIEKYTERIVCVGEVGLDFTPKFIRTAEDKELQLAAFRAQIELAKKNSLPLNVHSRSAAPQIFQLLDKYEYYDVLMHAYGGKAKRAALYARKGVYFSVPNTAAKEDSQMRNMIKLVPIDNLVLETDSPALSLTPRTVNEPKNLIISAQVIAEVKKLPLEEVISITRNNTLRLFSRITKLIKL